MCGRFLLTIPRSELTRSFRALRDLIDASQERLFERWNIAPSQPIVVVRTGADGVRELAAPTWGLVPFWTKPGAKAIKPINAKMETVATSPSFREAFKRRRCVVPASGFYEWQPLEGHKTKQPWAIVPAPAPGAGAAPLALAGVRERWKSPEGETVETAAIITTPPNAVMAPIHGRMPAVLRPDLVDDWLDPERSADAALALLGPAPDDALRAYRVSTFVNSPKNTGPRCVEVEE